jgi:hypothetical protein
LWRLPPGRGGGLARLAPLMARLGGSAAEQLGHGAALLSIWPASARDAAPVAQRCHVAEGGAALQSDWAWHSSSASVSLHYGSEDRVAETADVFLAEISRGRLINRLTGEFSGDVP